LLPGWSWQMAQQPRSASTFGLACAHTLPTTADDRTEAIRKGPLRVQLILHAHDWLQAVPEPSSHARRDELLDMQTRAQQKWAQHKVFEVDAPAEGEGALSYMCMHGWRACCHHALLLGTRYTICTASPQQSISCVFRLQGSAASFNVEHALSCRIGQGKGRLLRSSMGHSLTHI
jgi:hypothetical protein